MSCLLAAGCLPRPQPAQPQYQQQPQPAYAQPQAPATAQGGVAVTPTDPNAQAQPTASAQGGVTVATAQPATSASTQPAPPTQPAVAGQQPPYPAAQQPPAVPGAQPAQGNYYAPQPAQGNYYAPQPAQGNYYQPYRAPQPYPAPQPYGAPQPYPAPAAYSAPADTRRRHWNDGEVIADFAVVGTFGAIDLLARADFDNGNAVGFTLVAGMAAGGGVGYMLTQKYDVTAGTAHATTLGMTLGFANAALLIEPTGWTRSESILNLMFLGSAAGAAGGFIYGQAAELTSGQSLFVANLTLLGSATAALGAIAGSQDGEYGGWENGTLAFGINGGAVAGAVIAPSLNWSARRSKVVFAMTGVGALAGGMMAGLLANNNGEARTDNGDVVTGAMTAGLWGGFGLGILMTKDYSPDVRFAQRDTTPTVRQSTSSPTTVMPWVGNRGHLGLMTGGSF